MPKKTSRPARALTPQRSATVGERKTPRPLIDTEAGPFSAAEPNEIQPAREDINQTMPDINSTVTTARPTNSAGRPLSRRTTVAVKPPTLSREEEYAFIRTDLITVFILTVLMVAVIVALTFILGS